MADDQNPQLPLEGGTPPNGGTNLIPINIEEEMRRSYLDYSMSVIIGRALPRCPRRTQAGASPRALHAERDGPAAQQEIRQVRQGRGPGHGCLPSPRRLGHLRHAGAHGAAVLAALSAGGRAGQLRLGGRRSAGGHALHRVPHGAHRRRTAGRHRDGDRRLHAQLRRVHL